MDENSIFIHLRNHTEYSLLEGAVRIQQVENPGTKDEKKLHPIAQRCVANAMPAVAMTDTSNMFGAMFFSSACLDEGIKPILGCALNLVLYDNDDNLTKLSASDEKNFVVFLVQNEIGYKNLIKLVSLAHLDSRSPYGPAIAVADLHKHSEGLILLTGGAEGPLGNFILQGKKDRAEELLVKLEKLFPGRVYVEIQRHGLEEEESTEPVFLELAYKLGIPLVATNESYFMDEDMFEAHDALICIAEKTFVNVAKRRRLTPEHRFKSSEEMIALFEDLPEAVKNTVVIAKRCSFALHKMPPALPFFTKEHSLASEAEMLRKKAVVGLERRLEKFVYTAGMSEEEKKKAAKPYIERLEYELDVIIRMEFPGYFLIVSEFIQWSKANGVPVGPGRGSGAGSVVAWALTITDLNPLRFNLLFERFLNPERISMPDFDIDFCQENRGKTIEHVQNLYGKDSVAQIITFGKLQARAVLRDVGRVLQIPYPVVDRICKLVPNDPGKIVTLKQVYETNPDFKKEINDNESLQKLFQVASRLEGLNRNASTHAAGVVIGAKPLDEIVPLYRDPDSDMPVTQFDKNCVEDASLIKFDFLGLKTLTTIAKAVELVAKRGINLDMSSVPLDDVDTYRLLQEADSIGVFQLESSGMRKVLKELKPDKLEDIIAVVALFRPGPIKNIPPYIARKHGEEKPDYLHPMLEGILKETYGIMIYQEQVMQIAQVMGGYTLGAADLLRKAMGKKKLDEMNRQREIFIKGAEERGVDKATASNIFDQMEAFAGYGFNKSHAACYAFIAYQTAYLKAHYPLEFIAASMTMDSQNSKKIEMFKHEVVRMGAKVLPPDINKAQEMFSVENGAVRFSFTAIKGVGDEPAKAIVKERNANGEFKNFTDFLCRMDKKAINKKTLESLIKVGAFDSLGEDRAALFESLSLAGQFMDKATEDKHNHQADLFCSMPEEREFQTVSTPEWSLGHKLAMEKEALGFFLSAHPMDELEETLKRLQIRTSAESFEALSVGRNAMLVLAGIPGDFKIRIGKTGKPYAFIQASDSSGNFEMFCFSDVLSVSREKIASGRPLVFYVNAEKIDEDEPPRLTLIKVSYLDDVAKDIGEGIRIAISDASILPEVKKVVEKMRPGRSKIIFVADTGDWNVKIELSQKYTIAAAMISELRKLDGVKVSEI